MLRQMRPYTKSGFPLASSLLYSVHRSVTPGHRRRRLVHGVQFTVRIPPFKGMHAPTAWPGMPTGNSARHLGNPLHSLSCSQSILKCKHLFWRHRKWDNATLSCLGSGDLARLWKMKDHGWAIVSGHTQISGCTYAHMHFS
jgi:hypothetical protein